MATDPICGMSVRESADALQSRRDDRTYYFCSHECQVAFDAPERELNQLRRTATFALSASAVILALMFLPRVGPESTDQTQRMMARNWAMLAIATPVMLWPGARFARGLVHAVRARAANMDSLVALGTGTAFLYSAAITAFPHALGHETYFDVAVVVIAFVLLGRMLEHAMKRRATRALRELVDQRPAQVTRIREGREEPIPLADVRVGDRLRVRAGERVPVDAVIVQGEASIDESMLTGEPIPVTKQIGDAVVAATLDTDGDLMIEATRVGSDTAVAQIVAMVERAQAGRAPLQRLVDRASAIFVPLVVVVAVASAVAWWALTDVAPARAILPGVAVLLVACPCALGLATPAAFLVAAGSGARRGLLIKETDQLESLARADTVVFDKTGTLTLGRPRVVDVFPSPGVTKADLLSAAAAAEAGSNHPLAKAIVAAARARGGELPPVESVRERSGRGVTASTDGGQLLVGNAAWMRENLPQARLPEPSAEGSLVYAALDGRVLGAIHLADEEKPGAREAVQGLLGRGLKVLMLTGDRESAAKAMANRLGITEWRADVSAGEKAGIVESLRREGRRVVMVGDGINDAPALAAADAGIGLGGGTDVAREAGGLVLLKDDPRDVVNAIALARATRRKVHQNLLWASIYNVVLIPVAAAGILQATWAGAAMALSSVSVVANSLVLLAHRPPLESRSLGLQGARGAPPAKSIDPICGMTVDVARARHVHEEGEMKVCFCSAGCLERYRAGERAMTGMRLLPLRKE